MRGGEKMDNLSDKNSNAKTMRNIFSFLCASVYFISYFTRMDYKAVIAEIVSSEGMTNENASLALTALFISYGIGQFVFGWAGDKIKPALLLITGLSISAFSNLLIPFCPTYIAMTAVWCLNGVGQSMIWPPLVRIISESLNEDDYKKAIFKVNRGSALGAVCVYILSAILIEVSSWRSVFYVAAALALIGVMIVAFGINSIVSVKGKKQKTESKSEEDTKSSKPKANVFVIVCLFASLIAIALHGSLRDGVDAWMPTYISGHFSLDTSVSIMSGAIIPLFSLIAFAASTLAYKKIFKNELYCASAFFLLASVFCLLLNLFSDEKYPAFLSVACFTLIVGCMHAVDIMLVSYLPNRFKKYGRISLVAGIMNFSTYVGSAVSTFGFAAVAEKYGWDKLLIIWTLIAVIGGIICFTCIKKWKKYREE